MLKTKTVCKIGLLLSILFTLTGCWDREELEDNAYVVGLGLDKSEKDEKMIQITMLIANPEVGSMQGGGGSTEKPRELITFDANDFITAKSTANAVVSRDINYDLLKIIVVSEKFARDKNFYSWISQALNDKEIRQDAHLAVSKENPSEYFKRNKPLLETRPHKYFLFMTRHGIQNGLIPDSTLFRFFKTTIRSTDLFLAMYTTTIKDKDAAAKESNEYLAGQLDATGDIDPTQFIGSAIFKDGVMIGTLNGQETRIVNIFDDTTEIKDVYIMINDPFADTQKIALRMTKTQNNKVKMDVKRDKPKIDITLPLKFEVMSNPSMTNMKDKKNQDVLKEQIINNIKTNSEDFFKKTQQELKGVPYPLSIFARRYFLTIKEFEKFNWNKQYLEAEIHVTPEIEIVDFGRQIKRPKDRGV
jgi:spore germination protein KC